MRRGLAIVAGVLLGASACMAANYYRQMLMLPRAVASAPAYTTHADILIDFEAGTAGDLLTTNILNACTRTTRPLGEWRIFYGSANPSNLATRSGTSGFANPVAVGNDTYSTAGTVEGAFNTSNESCYAQYFFNNAGYSNVSVGAWVTIPALDSGQYMDFLYLKKGGGYDVVQIANITNTKVYLHTSFPTGSTGITVSVGSKYWITYLAPMSGNTLLSVYDASMTLVDTNYLEQPETASLYSWFGVGRTDAHGAFKNSICGIDNIMIDVTDATYPLGVSTDVVHSASFVSGYLLAENFEDNRRPIGFREVIPTNINWSATAALDGDRALMVKSSGKAYYDLCRNYSNIYMYAIVQPITKVNYRDWMSFSGPSAYNAYVQEINYNNTEKLKMYGAIGLPEGSLNITNGVTYHVWMEWEGGVSGRLYYATSPTKPATPQIDSSTMGGLATTSSVVRWFVLADGGSNYYDKLRISTNAIGSNPL